jgi:hypothetical protein
VLVRYYVTSIYEPSWCNRQERRRGESSKEFGPTNSA